MRRLTYIAIIFILVCGLVLAAFAPNTASMVFNGVMEGVLFLGVVFGVLPVTQFNQGFQHGIENIARAMEVQGNSTWNAVSRQDDFFHQKVMDKLFEDYKAKVASQQEANQILSDIEDYINEDSLSIRSWQNVVQQVPSTLTGLGILGTFIGLILGIQGIVFSSVDATLSAVETLLNGIRVAFYTSISGVILSLLFNFLYRISWNLMERNCSLFIEIFHRNVIPPVEEQERYRERKDLRKIIDLLEQIPKNQGFSMAQGRGGAPAGSTGNEQILMPQILDGLRNGEFIFFLQPKFDLNSRKIIGSEALVRWNHGKLGTVSPAVFIPILESNGYITKLDQHIWTQVCAYIRKLIDQGIRPLPIAINLSKTDILAMDVVEFFDSTVKKYRIPPRFLEIEIAENAYLQASNSTLEVEDQLRQKGFRVIMDGFNGDYVALSSVDGLSPDTLKLDLRHFNGNQNQGALNAVFDQARKLGMAMAVEGIENMEQLSMLRKSGCSEGQGFYLSRPVDLASYEKLIVEEKKS